MPPPTPPRGRTVGAAGTLMAAVTAAIVISTIGGGPATATEAAAGHTTPAAGPTVTPLAAAVVPGPIHVDRKARSNVVTARIEFRPGNSTGWHSHAGPVFVQVVSGALTLRHAANGRCLSDVVRAGHGFFEKPGAVHLAVNHRRHPAVVYATSVLPPGAPPADGARAPAACR